MYSKHVRLLVKKTRGLCSIVEGSPFRILNVSDVFGSATVVFVPRFPEEAPKFPEKFLHLPPHELERSPYPFSSGVSDFVAGFLTIWTLLWWHFSWALDHLKVPHLLGGFPKFFEGLLCNCERGLINSSPYLLFPLFNDGECFDRLIPLFMMGFLV